MAQFLAHLRRLLSRRLDPSSERRSLPEAGCEPSACVCVPPPRDEKASRVERLEYIALFAQAGYFNMGNAVDLLQPPVEPPPF